MCSNYVTAERQPGGAYGYGSRIVVRAQRSSATVIQRDLYACKVREERRCGCVMYEVGRGVGVMSCAHAHAVRAVQGYLYACKVSCAVLRGGVPCWRGIVK